MLKQIVMLFWDLVDHQKSHGSQVELCYPYGLNTIGDSWLSALAGGQVSFSLPLWTVPNA